MQHEADRTTHVRARAGGRHGRWRGESQRLAAAIATAFPAAPTPPRGTAPVTRPCISATGHAPPNTFPKEDKMTARQLVQSDLKVMSVDQIDTAHRAGQSARLLGASDEEVALMHAATGTLDPENILALAKAGRHDLIDAARIEGRLNLHHTTTKDD